MSTAVSLNWKMSFQLVISGGHDKQGCMSYRKISILACHVTAWKAIFHLVSTTWKVILRSISHF
jgi:hypothetical protein